MITKELPDASEATHRLVCAHCVGRNRTEYTMPCIILKDTGKSYKVLVFGDRCWNNTYHIKKVRYVPKDKVYKLSR